MIDIDLAALRAAAEGATPGSWVVSGPDGCLVAQSEAASWGLAYVTRNQADAVHIAAANPAVVLEILDALEDEQLLRRSLEAQVADGDNGRTMRFGALRAVLRMTRPMGLAETEEQP